MRRTLRRYRLPIPSNLEDDREIAELGVLSPVMRDECNGFLKYNPTVSYEAIWKCSHVLSSGNPEARGKEYLSARRGHHQRSPPGEFSALMTQCGDSANVSQWRVKGTNLPPRHPSLVGSSVVVLVPPKRHRSGKVPPSPYATAGSKRGSMGCCRLLGPA